MRLLRALGALGSLGANTKQNLAWNVCKERVVLSQTKVYAHFCSVVAKHRPVSQPYQSCLGERRRTHQQPRCNTMNAQEKSKRVLNPCEACTLPSSRDRSACPRGGLAPNTSQRSRTCRTRRYTRSAPEAISNRQHEREAQAARQQHAQLVQRGRSWGKQSPAFLPEQTRRKSRSAKDP